MCLVNLISIPEDGGHYLVTKVNIFLTLIYLKKGRIMMSMIMMTIYIECRCERLLQKMLFHGFWLVSMIFQGSFMVFGI